MGIITIFVVNAIQHNYINLSWHEKKYQYRYHELWNSTFSNDNIIAYLNYNLLESPMINSDLVFVGTYLCIFISYSKNLT